jgi:hypothetical protein
MLESLIEADRSAIILKYTFLVTAMLFVGLSVSGKDGLRLKHERNLWG